MWASSGRLRALGHQRRPSRTDAFAAIREIEECHHIAGEADHLLKNRARDTRQLEAIIRRLETTPNVFSTGTDMAFSSAFERLSTGLSGLPKSDGLNEA